MSDCYGWDYNQGNDWDYNECHKPRRHRRRHHKQYNDCWNY